MNTLTHPGDLVQLRDWFPTPKKKRKRRGKKKIQPQRGAIKRANRIRAMFDRMEQFRWRCPYCGDSFLRNTAALVNVTRDHFVPQSQGGRGAENILPCCPTCNTFKANLRLETVAQVRNWMRQKHKAYSELFAEAKRRARWRWLGRLLNGLRFAC